MHMLWGRQLLWDVVHGIDVDDKICLVKCLLSSPCA